MIYGTSREQALRLIVGSYVRDGIRLAMIAGEFAEGVLLMLWVCLSDAGFFLEMKGRKFLRWARLYGIPVMYKTWRFCMAVAVWMSIETISKALAFRRGLVNAWAFRQDLVDEWKEEVEG